MESPRSKTYAAFAQNGCICIKWNGRIFGSFRDSTENKYIKKLCKCIKYRYLIFAISRAIIGAQVRENDKASACSCEKRRQDMVYDNAEAVLQNLRDAGCDARTIERFMELLQAGKITEELGLLDAHRSALLRRVHADEKRIDCLDYLIYQIEQNKITL